MRHISFAKIKQRLNNGLVAALFVAAQVGAVTVPFLHATPVHATPVCTVDTAGANDEPGQKDLTKLCVDYAGVPTTVATSWNWDETGTNGANTMDACNLFDTDGDGNVNYSVCVTTTDDPAEFATLTTYSCGDAKSDRCTSAITVVSSGTTDCDVNQVTNDPFANGSSAPKDTEGSCTVQLSTVGGTSAKLIDVCSYPSEQPNSDPSDCVIAQPKAGKLEVVKDLVPSNDSGLFNLQIDGTTDASNVGDNGSTGEVVVDEGDHSVGETAGTNTSLASYTSSISCKDLNGTGSVVASGPGTSLANVPIADGADVVCTITNTKLQGSITLIKNVINNNGGSADANQFGLTIGGNSVTSGQKVTLSPGSYAINEAGLAGYSFVNITGTDCPTTLGGNVDLANGQDIVCTITNDDIAPTLTLVKTVVNNNGGSATTANFQGKIDASNVAWSTAIPVSAGSHTATEAALAGGAGYAASSWGGDCAANGTITLSLGQNATCTITNDDIAPSLTLNKIISNTHGGTATESNWLLTALGPTNLSGQGAAGSADVVSSNNFAAGTYTLGESGGPSGYSASVWTCTNGVIVTNNQITLANGQTTVCSITNSDIAPIITIIKQVINPYGATTPSPDSFLLTLGGNSVTSGTDNEVSAGSYVVGETTTGTGYSFTSFTGENCTVDGGIMSAIGVLGGHTTCTITNTAIQPKLIVIKHVINDNSGTQSANDFTMTVSGNSQNVPNFPGSEAGTEIGLNEGNYSVDELADAGYVKSLSSDCVGTISVGQVKTCTVTNNDVAHPAITVVKNGPATAHEGDQVTYTFDVTNTGDTATISSVTVVDNIAGNATYVSGDTNNDGLLQKTETWHFSANYVIPADTTSNVVNTAQACGYDPDQTKVCDTDNHSLDVLHPGLNVVKSGPNEANQGDQVTYTFTVTNTGDTPLSVTTVNDNIAGDGTYVSGDTNSNDLLDLNETWVYNADYTIPANQEGNVVNTVTVCGQDSLEGEDCDTDTHTLVVLAKVIVTKYNDLNRNGIQDEGEPTLPNWEFTLSCSSLDVVQLLEVALDQGCQNKTQTTGQDGTTTFTDVQPGQTYELNETIPADSNWNLSNIDCGVRQGNLDGDTFYLNNVTPGETVNCSVGNYQDTGTITVVKKLTPSTDQGKFNLNINGTTYATNVGDNGTTGAQAFVTGEYTVSETAGTNTSLDDYEASYNCVTVGGGTVASGTGTSVKVTLSEDGQNIVCTFTNNKGEILGATAPLVNTGNSILTTTLLSLGLITTVAGLAIVGRRRNPRITFISK